MFSPEEITSLQRRAEEKRILGMAGELNDALNGVNFDTLTIAQVFSLLDTASLLAQAVLHKDTEITVKDA